VRTGAGVKQSDGAVSSQWFVRRRSARREEPEEEDEVRGKKENLSCSPTYTRGAGVMGVAVVFHYRNRY
jgi:hypothetical protein